MIKIKFEPEAFYSTYSLHREYFTPTLKKKNLFNYKKNFWDPGRFEKKMTVLEIGCGVGWFGQYLESKGITNYHGLDTDSKILA